MNLSMLLGTLTHKRIDCIKCGGENSLSISRDGQEIKWHCFRASCGYSGIDGVQMSPEHIRRLLEARTAYVKPFELPDYWTMGIASEKCLKMLLKTNGKYAYDNGLFSCAYDPRLNRFVYLVQSRGNIVGAIGRTLSNARPKSYNYPNSAKVPFIVSNGDILVLVEDCASACAVVRKPNHSGLALLGTRLKQDYIPFIKDYKTVIVALDKDARNKSIILKNILTYYHNDVRVWLLDKDIKDMTDLEVQAL